MYGNLYLIDQQFLFLRWYGHIKNRCCYSNYIMTPSFFNFGAKIPHLKLGAL